MSDCNHKNIVKIKAASFDGVIVKMMCPTTQSNQSLFEIGKKRHTESSSSNTSETVTRQLRSVIPSQSDDSLLLAEEDRLEAAAMASSNSQELEPVVVKRQGPICYYVMNFAKYGELFRLVEINERLSEDLVRYLFK